MYSIEIQAKLGKSMGLPPPTIMSHSRIHRQSNLNAQYTSFPSSIHFLCGDNAIQMRRSILRNSYTNPEYRV